MNWKRIFTNNRLLMRLIISYLITSVFLTGILMVVVSGFISKRVKHQTEEASYDLLRQSYETANYALTDIYGDYYNLWSKNELIIKSLSSDKLSKEERESVSNLIDRETFRNDLIDSIYLINKKADLVISNTSFNNKIDNFYDKNAIKLFNDFEKYYPVYKKETFFPRKSNFNLYGEELNKDFISIIYANKDNNGKITSGIIVNIDQSKISSLVNVRKDRSIMVIVNGRGKIISDTEGISFAKNLPRDDSYMRIANNPNKEDSFIGNYIGEKSLITYRRAENIGFVFISITPYSFVENEVIKVNTSIGIIFVLAMIVSLLVSIYSTKKIYSPLNELIKNMRENHSIDMQSSMDEYAFLGNTYNSLMIKNKRSHISRILSGNYSKTSLEILGYNEIDKFITFVITIDDSENPQELLESVMDIINSNTNWSGAITATNSISCIINEENFDDKTIIAIMETLDNLQNVIYDELQIVAAIGLGTFVNSLDSIKFSHRYANIASHHSKSSEENRVTYYKDIEDSKIAASQNKDSIADKIEEYILNNFTRADFSADEIAAELNLSLGYIRQIFKGEKNVTINDFIINIRINRAKELLETTDNTAKDIGESIGYYDNRYFYTLFKKKVGMTTEEYRKLRKEEAK